MTGYWVKGSRYGIELTGNVIYEIISQIQNLKHTIVL